jgi:hypothetical protein
VNQDVDDFIWETEWNAIHSAGTSVMGGYKLGSQKTKRKQFRVGLFSSAEKRIITNSFSPCVVAEWDHEPTMAEIVEGLKQVCQFFLGNDYNAELNYPPRAWHRIESQNVLSELSCWNLRNFNHVDFEIGHRQTTVINWQ